MEHQIQGMRCLAEVIRDESDETLAARAATDSAALAELYYRYNSQIEQFCTWKLGDPDVAADVASQAWIKVLEALNRQQVRDFRSWLWTIVRNEVTNVFRRLRPTIDVDDVFDLISDEPSPEESAIATGEIREIMEMIPKLPKAQQSVLALRLSGWTNQEICKELGKSYSWVGTTQFRALTNLRALLAEAAVPGKVR